MMNAPLKPTSIKFTPEEKRFLKRIAKAQGHAHLSKVVRQLIRREMQLTTTTNHIGAA